MKESSIAVCKVGFFGMKLGRRHTPGVYLLCSMQKMSVHWSRLEVVWDKQPGKICMAVGLSEKLPPLPLPRELLLIIFTTL